MKLYSSEHSYLHSWGQVTAAAWRKYPNDSAPHVLTVDVINREVDVEAQILRTERLITMKQNIPSFVSKFFTDKEPVSYVHELSEVDLKTQTMTAKSTNITYRDIMTMEESISYSLDRANPAQTTFKQEAAINVYITRFGSYLEDMVLTRFKANAHKGRQGLEQVLDMILLESQIGLQHLKDAVVHCEELPPSQR
ncbi:Phospholipid metabolism protein [Sorochytrium milnesiophthora]